MSTNICIISIDEVINGCKIKVISTNRCIIVKVICSCSRESISTNRCIIIEVICSYSRMLAGILLLEYAILAILVLTPIMVILNVTLYLI